MTACVLVPWQPGCEHREANWAHVHDHLTANWPTVIGELPAGFPWCKAAAVDLALEQTDADVLVIHDADVLVPPAAIDQAIATVHDGAPWAMPHRRVRRLAQRSTLDLIEGREWNPGHVHRVPYEGVKAGGVLVIRRDIYEGCPFDPRFTMWGGEDEALWRALTLLHEPVARFDAELVHLWHPWVEHGMSKATTQLLARYKHAFRKSDRDAMRQLIEEATCSTSLAS